MTNWECDNLITHLGAMSLHIDGFRTDTHDLVQDLNLEPNKMIAYFMELGCRIGNLRQKEREAIGVREGDAKSRKMAILEIPLQFPKPKGKRQERR
jgi:DNA-directed RNA polymerase I subunit RPA49